MHGVLWSLTVCFDGQSFFRIDIDCQR